MVREMAKIKILTAREADTKGDGFHADGGNLFLKVRGAGRSWVFRYKQNGVSRDIGLGATHTRSLKEARDIAEKMRRAVKDGKDPTEIIRIKPVAKMPTFGEYALELVENKKTGWRNAKHAAQWLSTLADYAFPAIGDKLPANVTLADIKGILLPIWATKTETATRLRQRIEAVLDFATVTEKAHGRYNPARWRGNLDAVLPKASKVSTVKHFASAPFEQVPSIMAALRAKDALSAYCLRFIILTACRSGEARGATWDEIDLAAKIWTIPAARIKANREHRIPLSDESMDILRVMNERRIVGTDRIFAGGRGGLLSDVAVSKMLHDIMPDATVHGFRSSFRVWGAIPYPAHVMEAALAHANKDKVEAAYLRSDFLEKRREVMNAWGAYLTGGSNVIQMRVGA